MITRAEYREQMNTLTNRRKNPVLTDAEFNRMPASKQFDYALKQKKRGLPVTVEQDTPYDTAKADTHYEPQTVATKKKVGLGIGFSIMAILSKIDIILSYCGIAGK